jgi:DNA-binding NarL/FixJ family response regulator
MNTQTNVALVDDHVLLRSGLAKLIRSFGNYTVVLEASNGKDFIAHFKTVPAIVLMDINMPEMDGYETTLWLRKNHPDIKVLALSMYDNENAVIKMFKAGAKGYILKDCEPAELKAAFDALISKGYYYSEMVTGRFIHTMNSLDQKLQLSERETNFLKLVCSELTYKEIAEKMFVSPRTVDGYRDDLFEKLNVKTRVGLVMYAIKNGIVTL